MSNPTGGTMKKLWTSVAPLLLCALCGNQLLLKAQTPRRKVAFTIDDLPMARLLHGAG